MAEDDDSNTCEFVSMKDQFASLIKTFTEQVREEKVSDEEVDDIQGQLKSCSSFILGYTNSRRSVNRLPPEILRLVFLEYVQTTDFADRFASGKIKDIGWPHTHLRSCNVLSLTHVCRRWREVAIDLPTLWTSIRDTRAAETREFLRRTKGFPLKLLIAAAGTRSEWFWDICMECGASIEELHWFSGNNSSSGDLAAVPALDIKAPNVQRLSLSRVAGDKTRFRNASVLRGATTNVKVLSLNDINWFPTNQFPALTHLVLSGSMSLADLLSFLSHCPCLQTLILRGGVSILNSAASMSTSMVQLPQLRRLSLDLDPCGPLRPLLLRLVFDRTIAAIEIVMSTLKVDTLRGMPIPMLDIPSSLTRPVVEPADYLAQPLTRLYLLQSPTSEAPSALMALSDTGGVRFTSPVPFAFMCAHILSASVALALVTDVWIAHLDDAAFQLFAVLRRELPALQTLTLVRPERADAAHRAFGMFVQSLRMIRTGEAAALPAPALRVVLGARALEEAGEAMEDVLYELCGSELFREKKNRLIVRAPAFPAEYYERVLPMLVENWESVVTEVDQDKLDMPPVAHAEAGFPAWHGW